MSYLSWSENLDVGVDQMNSEHVELIRLMNVVYDKSGGNKHDVINALQTLVKYTKLHFDNEEAYMESIGYEGLARHRIIHADLLKRVGAHIEAFRASQDSALSKEFFGFLRFWLVAHIQGIDTKYGKGAAALNKAG